MLVRRKGRGGAYVSAGAAGVALAVALSASDASALQPLSAFLERAETANPDVLIAAADAKEKDAEASVAFGRLLPDVTARGVYTRNPSVAPIPLLLFLPDPMGKTTVLGSSGTERGDLASQDVTILKENQLDAFFQLDVPIFDAGSIARYRVSRAAAAAGKLSGLSAQFEAQRAVVRGYYSVLGAASLVISAQKSEDVAQKNLVLVRDRRNGGVASDLDVQRAAADVARAQQNVADAELMLDLATRGLESASGLRPTGTDTGLPPDDLHDESALAGWMAKGGESPDARVAQANLHVAEVGQSAAKLAFIPTIAGTASEHITNAPSLVPLNEAYQFTLSASWRLDYSLIATLHQADALAASARARRDKALRASDDAIYEAWMRVRAGIVKSRAARAGEDAANEAARIAQERYVGGIATQLDVVTAQRDAFQAEVGRVSADADLQAARMLLRLAAGRPMQAGRTP